MYIGLVYFAGGFTCTDILVLILWVFTIFVLVGAGILSLRKMSGNDLNFIHIYVQDGSLRTVKIKDIISMKIIKHNFVNIVLENGDSWDFSYEPNLLKRLISLG